MTTHQPFSLSHAKSLDELVDAIYEFTGDKRELAEYIRHGQFTHPLIAPHSLGKQEYDAHIKKILEFSFQVSQNSIDSTLKIGT